ncbi:putative lipoprotein [Geobacter metallireducens RCH3]|nr:putative lipoprotein [Geobacter metallireducens RCH3]
MNVAEMVRNLLVLCLDELFIATVLLMESYVKSHIPYMRRRVVAVAACGVLFLLSVLPGCKFNKAQQESSRSVETLESTAIAGKKTVAPPPQPEEPRFKPVSSSRVATPKNRYRTGENPEVAAQAGWPVKSPNPLPGAILPGRRIVAYYGNPLSKKMGALGEHPKDDMLRRLKEEVSRWEKADPSKPVQPALHLIAVVAQGDPGKSGKYRMVMPDDVVNQVHEWAREANALMFIDIQTGHENIRTLLPRFEWLLKNPDVHLGIDPEFNLVKSGAKPGTKIGTYDAADINYVTEYLSRLVKTNNLPPKVLTVHRFTRNGVTNARKITLRPEVQIVMHMDGWGAPSLKRDSYADYIVAEPVQYTGFKLFYHNDTKKGDPMMTPREVLMLDPKPLYVQYQ